MTLTNNHIREQITKMAAMVELSFGQALNKEISITIAENTEEQINEFQALIDDLTFKYIALKSPNSRDLRLAISIIKINPTLEKIGDLCLSIKKHNAELDYNFSKLEMMGHIVKELLKNSIDAFVHGNLEQAKQLINRDEELHQIGLELVEEFLMAMKNNKIEHKQAIKALWIAKNFERIDILASDISREVFFIESATQYPYKSSSESLDINKYLNSLNENNFSGVTP